MPRVLLQLTLLTAIVLAPIYGSAQSSFALKSVSVDLPGSGRTFSAPGNALPDPGSTIPGAGADAINGNCLTCHSAGMVLNQPDLPRAAWQAEVEKMIRVYKAPISETDVAAIVDYLAKTKGTQ